MSDMQDAWLSEYLQCLNATEAARRAGYKWPNKKGPELKQQFADEIQAILRERIPSPEAVVSRVADIAMADLTDYIMQDGSLDLEAMKADGRGYLLKKYKHTRNSGTRKSGDEWESESWDTELYPADAAQDRLMRYHGLYSDKLDVKGKLIIDYVNDWRNPSDED
jgi:phage terminase small subunit